MHCSPTPETGRGFVLVLDVGTTGVKAFVFDSAHQMIGKAYHTLGKTRPEPGWVEQDPQEVLRAAKAVMKQVVRDTQVNVQEIRGMGITNQREATIVWDAQTGKAIYPVIGWEDDRTRAYCVRLRKKHAHEVRQQTGLPLDAYFSASKIHWILEHVPQAQTLRETGRLRFGTIDSWLLYHLCSDQPHVTDETNASRTLLFDLQKRQWSDALCRLFGIPSTLLPRVLPSRGRFGTLAESVVGAAVPVVAVCGDQQASTYAALRAQPTTVRAVTKVTYGTGVFLVQVLGKRFLVHPPFFTTLVPGLGSGSWFALEAKLEGSGETVDRLLNDHPVLLAYFTKLAKKVQRFVAQLPVRPKQIVVDGGIARDGFVAEAQVKQTGISACLQQPYDGTALGCSLLIWDVLKKK